MGNSISIMFLYLLFYSKEILLQYQELTDYSDETCQAIYRGTKEAIEKINPEKEYDNEEFVNAFRLETLLWLAGNGIMW